MATTFLEPGGDADFLVGTTNGFWKGGITGGPAVATDFVHGAHVKSIKILPNALCVVRTGATVVDAGSRISAYFYFVALPTSTSVFSRVLTSGLTPRVSLRLTSVGALQLWNATGQIGTDGATIATGTWYRISLAYTITDSTHNRFEVFVDGVSSISVTNATLAGVSTDRVEFGNVSDATLAFRTSDHYIDSSNALTDPGNIWVTAKRPNANGTANNFTTQIGSGGSGYGSGHSPQVNERPLSVTNGWSVVAVGATTEEYNIESASTGDINISTATIVDYLGWISTSALVGETVNVIVNGVNFAQAITTTNTLYTKIAGSTTYPAGTGADIGETTDATATTVSLFECGVIVAYIPSTNTARNLSSLGAGA